MATPNDYASAIARTITDDTRGNYEAIGALVRLYRTLHPDEQRNMAAGLAAAIERLADQPGAQADAIHVAYHLELFAAPMPDTVALCRMASDSRPIREAMNYAAYQAAGGFR